MILTPPIDPFHLRIRNIQFIRIGCERHPGDFSKHVHDLRVAEFRFRVKDVHKVGCQDESEEAQTSLYLVQPWRGTFHRTRSEYF